MGQEIAASAVVGSPSYTASAGLSNGPQGFDLDAGNYAQVSTDSNCWIQIDFGSVQTIGKIRLQGGPDSGGGSQAMILLVSENGADWVQVGAWAGQAYYDSLSPWFKVNRVDVRYIRVTKDSPNYFRMFYMGVDPELDILPACYLHSCMDRINLKGVSIQNSIA